MKHGQSKVQGLVRDEGEAKEGAKDKGKAGDVVASARPAIQPRSA
jgi:hypothetical protein